MSYNIGVMKVNNNNLIKEEKKMKSTEEKKKMEKIIKAAKGRDDWH